MPNLNNYGLSLANMALCPESVHDLHRGFTDIPTVMFQFPTLVLGIFSRKIPERITMEDVKNHKTANAPGDYYFVGMSEDNEVAKDLGRNNYLTVDPSLFREVLVDVHESYRKHLWNFPARMEREKEYFAVAVLFCSIKSITLNDRTIPNPFYIAGDNQHPSALNDFRELYQMYVALLRNQYAFGITPSLTDQFKQFFAKYLKFYDDYALKNPFKLSISELEIAHPEFMHYLTGIEALKNPTVNLGLFSPAKNLASLVLEKGASIFLEHEYTKPERKVTKVQQISCYEDPYSYGCSYD